MKRIIIAAIVGGIIVFVWSAIAHIVLPLGTMGLNVMGNEDAVVESMRANIPASGMYIFPGGDMKKMTPEQQKEWEAKMKRGPYGLLIYTATGTEGMTPKMLVCEFLTNVLAAFLAAWLVSLMVATYGMRAFAVAVISLFGWISLTWSYWIWYHFSSAYTAAEGITEFVGWLLAGFAIAKIVPPRVATAA